MGKIIHDALAQGSITEGGGHAAAAGFALSADKENLFCDFLENAVKEQLNGEYPHQEILVDAELDAGSANMKLVNKMSAL